MATKRNLVLKSVISGFLCNIIIHDITISCTTVVQTFLRCTFPT